MDEGQGHWGGLIVLEDWEEGGCAHGLVYGHQRATTKRRECLVVEKEGLLLSYLLVLAYVLVWLSNWLHIIIIK